MAANSVARVTALPQERKRRTSWFVPPHAPSKPEDLTFIGRDEDGRFSWWSVTLPKTDYWPAHQVLGRAYAFELLDLINNPAAEFPEDILSFIVDAQFRARLQGMIHAVAP